MAGRRNPKVPGWRFLANRFAMAADDENVPRRRREPKDVEYDDGRAPPKPKTLLDYVRSISLLHVFFLLLFALPTIFGMYEWLASHGYLGAANVASSRGRGRVNWAARESIKAVYRDYNPEKLKGKELEKLNAIMDKYAGREDILLRYVSSNHS